MVIFLEKSLWALQAVPKPPIVKIFNKFC